MSRNVRISSKNLLLIALTCSALAVGMGCQRHRDKNAFAHSQAAQNRRQAHTVVSARAIIRDVPITIDALGTVTPTHSVIIRARIDGQLMRVFFKEGRLVQAGDLLAELDPRPYQAALEQAEGQLAQHQAVLANARLDLARYKKLLAEDSVAQQTFDTQAALVRQYEGVVKVDQGQVRAAQLNLAYTRITSPISGQVGLRQLDPGNLVRAADLTGIVTVNALQPVTIVFSVPEDHLPAIMSKVRLGVRLKVRAYDRARRNLLANGALLAVDNQIDPSNGTVKLKAQFPNRDLALFPQQFVNVQLLVDTLKNALLVPTAAIQHGAAGAFVYVIDPNDKVSAKPVTTGAMHGAQGDYTVVASGLASGARVVVEGADRLTEGALVTLHDGA